MEGRIEVQILGWVQQNGWIVDFFGRVHVLGSTPGPPGERRLVVGLVGFLVGWKIEQYK